MQRLGADPVMPRQFGQVQDVCENYHRDFPFINWNVLDLFNRLAPNSTSIS
jgi:hypothetical protein